MNSYHSSLTLFSSVGGAFSEIDVHNLQDLVRIVRPVRLKVYNGSEIERHELIGEGGSYRVFRGKYHASQVMALKQVKYHQIHPSKIISIDEYDVLKKIWRS